MHLSSLLYFTFGDSPMAARMHPLSPGGSPLMVNGLGRTRGLNPYLIHVVEVVREVGHHALSELHQLIASYQCMKAALA